MFKNEKAFTSESCFQASLTSVILKLFIGSAILAHPANLTLSLSSK
jgi:hypothetical protein